MFDSYGWTSCQLRALGVFVKSPGEPVSPGIVDAFADHSGRLAEDIKALFAETLAFLKAEAEKGLP